MKVQRLKSIDVFRGLCMFWIVLTHLIDWWLNSEFIWLHRITVMLFDSFGASGLLFISGVSIALSYR
ncbi:MAG: OpgC domain-containing protein, partial [Promethearchaeota archaeon]